MKHFLKTLWGIRHLRWAIETHRVLGHYRAVERTFGWAPGPSDIEEGRLDDIWEGRS